MSRQCSDCRYWAALDEGTGRCIIEPPKATLVPVQNVAGQASLTVVTFWPETRATDYCGMFAVLKLPDLGED